MSLKWIPRCKPGASKSRPRWVAHTLIGNVWEYPPGVDCAIRYTIFGGLIYFVLPGFKGEKPL